MRAFFIGATVAAPHGEAPDRVPIQLFNQSLASLDSIPFDRVSKISESLPRAQNL
jgi:hypothetical protein